MSAIESSAAAPKTEAKAPIDTSSAIVESPVAAAATEAPATEETPAEKKDVETAQEADASPADKFISTVTPATDVAAAAPVQDKAAAAPSDGVARWPALALDHPLSKFLAELPKILETTDHSEVYGVPLVAGSELPDFHTLLILQKFLRANANDLEKAKVQLLGTLEWRKEFNPLKATEEIFPAKKFGGLGYVTEIDSKEGKGKDIVTWNIYGAVKDYGETFLPLDE
jgi:hypothetical protein